MGKTNGRDSGIRISGYVFHIFLAMVLTATL